MQELKSMLLRSTKNLLSKLGEATDSAEGNKNSLLRRKKKKSSSSTRPNGLLTKFRSSKSSGSSRSVSSDELDGCGVELRSKTSSEEVRNSASIDEESEDVFGRGASEETENSSRVQNDEDDDNLSIISENILNSGTVCGLNHEHLPIKILDEKYSIAIERMYELLFADGPFGEELANKRKIFGVVSTPWVDGSEGYYTKTRTLNYTVPINIPFYAKRAESVEKQMMDSSSKPGRRYLVDTENDTSGIPYGDTFTLLTRFCITQVSRKSCRLIVSGHVRFGKPVVAFVKSLVYKTCSVGFNNNFRVLSELLRDEESRLGGRQRPLAAGSEVEPTTSGNRSCPDGSVTTKRLSDSSDTRQVASEQMNGKANGAHNNEDLSSSSNTHLSGNQSVLSTPVSGFIVVIFMLFFVLMCVNISLMVMLCTMDLPELATYTRMPSAKHQTTEKTSTHTHDTQGFIHNSRPQSNSETSLHDLFSHIVSIKDDLRSNLFRYETNKRLFAPPEEGHEPSGSCEGDKSSPECLRGRAYSNVDRSLRDIIALQSELHAAHLTRLYTTLSATTDLMRIVQQSLQDLMKTSVEADANVGIQLNEGQ